MKVEYTRENSGSYMELSDFDIEDSFEMKMLRNNKPERLLDMFFRQINNKYKYYYNITGKSNIAETYSKRKMTGEELFSLTDSISLAINEMKKYMLNENGLRLEPELIYKDIYESRFYLTYFFDDTGSLWDGLKSLFEYIIGIIDHSDNEAVTYGYGIYKRLCTKETSIDNLFKFERRSEAKEYEVVTETFVQEDVLPEIRKEENEVTDYTKIYMVYSVFICLGILEIIMLVMALSDGARPKILPRKLCAVMIAVIALIAYGLYTWFKKNKQGLVRLVTKEVVLPYEKEHVRIILPEKREESRTVVLNRDDDKPMLKWQENGIMKQYTVEDNTVVGSSKEYADCVINNPGVSRAHIKFIKEDNGYLLKDLNSTNGTALNNNMIAAYQLVPVKRGDIINIGNLDILFH